MHETRGTLRTWRQWGTLGVLYRIDFKNPVTKTNTFQYVIPEALGCLVLKGVQDESGDQEGSTLWLARQIFYWDMLGKD